MKINLERLYRILDYKFNQPLYLKQALTHCSVSRVNYERLEFLGDSILNFIITHELFKKFPTQTEGQLSQLRSALVRGEMLALLAKELNLGDYLLLGQGELKSGGFRRASILSDSLEAIFAAVFLDGGIQAAKKVILKIFHTKLNDPNLINYFKDSKTLLQEYLQANKQPLPKYILTKTLVNEQEQIFYITCLVGENLVSKAKAYNKKAAEQLAATRMLEQLQSLL